MSNIIETVCNKIHHYFLFAGPKKKNVFSTTATLKPISKKRLKDLLKTEVDFYDWVKSRLLNGTTEKG